MMYHYPIKLTMWEKINYYSVHTATGFAFVYHFFVDGTFLKYFAIEFFGLFISLFMFLGIIDTNAQVDIGHFGGNMDALVVELDQAFGALDTGLQPLFLSHLEEEFFGPGSSGLTKAQESVLREWFYDKYQLSLHSDTGLSRNVSIEYSVLDDTSSSKAQDLVFPTLEEETFSASSYVEVLSQLGLLDD